MVDRDRQSAVTIHLRHLAEKIRPMLRPPLQDVELPLMNHFVRQRVQNLLLAVRASPDNLMKQGKREANLACGLRAKAVSTQPWPGSASTDDHADRGGQPAAPDKIDWRQQTGEISAVQFAPHLGQMLRGYRSRLAWSHAKGVIPMLRTPPRPTTAP